LGRPFLRCGNAGWSGWIDARGIVREVLENEEGSIYFEGAGLFELLLPERNRTLYVRYGDYFLIACLSLFSLSYLIKCKRIDLGEEYG
jgi:apolipoprotein N-acyltransferase